LSLGLYAFLKKAALFHGRGLVWVRYWRKLRSDRVWCQKCHEKRKCDGGRRCYAVAWYIQVPPIRFAFSSEEVELNWNKWIRQTHRWLSTAFTVAVIINIVAIAQKKYNNSMGFLAVAPLVFLFLTGLYLWVLPYANKWRKGRRAD
jgi:hypothetical protein